MIFRGRFFAGAAKCCHSWLSFPRERVETWTFYENPLILNPKGTEGQILINAVVSMGRSNTKPKSF